MAVTFYNVSMTYLSTIFFALISAQTTMLFSRNSCKLARGKAGQRFVYRAGSTLVRTQWSCLKQSTARSSTAAIRFTKEHEWIRQESGTGTVGLTDHAQTQMGDVVFVDLPTVDKQVGKDDAVGAVESVKSASDIYSPVSGTVVAVNEALNDDPELINRSPQDEGWIYKIQLSQPEEFDTLLTEDDYKKLLEDEEES